MKKIETRSPREALREAFHLGLIDDEEKWVGMLDDRNMTSHVYNQTQSKVIFEHVKEYAPVMQKTYTALKERYFKNLD